MKDPTDWLVTPDLNKPENWTYPIKHDYIKQMVGLIGGDTIFNLQDIINNRVVAIMLHGGSVREFEERINEFADIDFCYLSLNRFNIMEKNILSKVNKQLDIVFLMSEQEMPRRIDELKEFLDRPKNNCLMTTFSALSWLNKQDWEDIVTVYSTKLYIMPRLLCRPTYPISLALILDELVRNDVKHVVLFGADGYLTPGGGITWDQQAMLSTYYDPGFFINEKRASGLSFGTKHFNDTYIYDPKQITVWNCSLNSFYKPFPKVSYDQLRRFFHGNENRRIS